MSEHTASKNPESAALPQNQTAARSVHFSVRPGVEAKAVHLALDRIFELNGCVGCGMAGIIDLMILPTNPPISDGLTKAGIVGISQNLRGF